MPPEFDTFHRLELPSEISIPDLFYALYLHRYQSPCTVGHHICSGQYPFDLFYFDDPRPHEEPDRSQAWIQYHYRVCQRLVRPPRIKSINRLILCCSPNPNPPLYWVWFELD
ncbi:hypothetical protein GS597_16120 [Synechococcales cyanobacterium C]|uniref:Uncharacterized protein n=1 Tax=Petrachloros mirabilis ULC683 TaxID=2781853 RepID=A0A8K2A9B1_9CYAN|nr:hypothetical protein [Petrachloros mirabilis]NCJ08005.1 hypothetical protein [Petrachloros mirabilis ULC683]